MIVMAMRSSTTARVRRNERSPDGRCEPMTASTARAKAMSVAVGMAQPRSASPSPPKRVTTPTKTTAGTATPQNAATTGTAALAGERRSPTRNSRLSSRPATKKKIARRPSAAQWPRLRRRWNQSVPISVSRNEKYASLRGLLARMIATTAAPRRTAPPMVSVRRALATNWVSAHVEGRERRRWPSGRRPGGAEVIGRLLTDGAGPRAGAARSLPTRLPGAPCPSLPAAHRAPPPPTRGGTATRDGAPPVVGGAPSSGGAGVSRSRRTSPA